MNLIDHIVDLIENESNLYKYRMSDIDTRIARILSIYDSKDNYSTDLFMHYANYELICLLSEIRKARESDELYFALYNILDNYNGIEKIDRAIRLIKLFNMDSLSDREISVLELCIQ